MGEPVMRNVFESALGAIKAAAEANASHDKTDFRDDEGLLRCGLCGDRKELRVWNWFTKSNDVVRRKCKCQKEREAADQDTEDERSRRNLIRQLRMDAFTDKSYWKMTFEADDSKSLDVSIKARRYAERFEQIQEKGLGLLFCGSTGTGKTFYAAAIVNALVDRNIPCLMRTVTDIDMWMQEEGRKACMEKLAAIPLLVIDDMAAERQTEYTQEIVTRIIDERSNRLNPMIVTTNVNINSSEHADQTQSRIYSRLRKLTVPILVPGPDRRMQEGRSAFEEMRKLLG